MKKYIALAVVAAAICLVPAALADATHSVYGGTGQKTQQNLGKSTTVPHVEVKAAKSSATQTTAKPTSGNLPFTGMDLGFVGLAGVALAGMGYSLRRLARDTDTRDTDN
jgi:hypothetical protein